MSQLKHVSIRQRVALFIEAVFMTWLVPKDRVGPIYKRLFKVPLLLRRLGLGLLIPRNVLILTTRGRRSGKLRSTPMEYGPGPQPGVYLVMSGWDGKTDWYRNARADPRVGVWLGGREWEAVAEPVPEAEVARLLRDLAEMSPLATRMWSRWGGVEIDGSDACYLAAAPHFPCLYVRPVAA